jgi:hypothetical protein
MHPRIPAGPERLHHLTRHPQPVEWRPSSGVVALWVVLSSVLAIAGVFLFAALYAVARQENTVSGAGLELLAMVAGVVLLTAAVMVLHEWVHGLVMRRFGARPEYGAGVMYRFMPYLYCTASGHEFTRGQFIAITAAPALVISALGALWVSLLPYGGWLVVPLGLHLGGCVGDLWVLGVLLRQPAGTLVEDTRTGMRLLRPV